MINKHANFLSLKKAFFDSTKDYDSKKNKLNIVLSFLASNK